MNKAVLVVGAAFAVPLVVVLAVGFQNDPHQIDSPLVGKPAPGFSLTTLDGTPYTLKGPAVVNFWATWCVPCQAEHPHLLAASREYGDRVSFVGVVYQDTPQAIGKWLDRFGSAYPTVVDEGGRVAIAYGVYGVPETFVVGPDGTVVEKFTGPVTANQLAPLLEKW